MNSASQPETPSAGAKVVGVNAAAAPLPAHGPSKENARRLLLQGTAWCCLAALSVVVDFLMPPAVTTFNRQPTGLMMVLPLVGCLLAQGSLLAAWLVWGDAPFSRRLVWHWVIAGCLCCVWLIGLVVARPPEGFRVVGFTVALTVPVVSLGAQLPLWIVRLLFGWRLVRITALPTAAISAATPPAEQPLSIRDLMLATLIVAVSFAVARLSPAAQQDKEFGYAWGLYMAGAATFSLLAIIPAAAILLRPRPLVRAVRYSLYLAAAPIALLWLGVVIACIYAPGILAPWFVFVGLTLFILSYAGTAILAAVVARDQGYVLGWRRSGPKVTRV